MFRRHSNSSRWHRGWACANATIGADKEVEPLLRQAELGAPSELVAPKLEHQPFNSKVDMDSSRSDMADSRVPDSRDSRGELQQHPPQHRQQTRLRRANDIPSDR